MSAPLVWIVFPAVGALFLLVFYRWRWVGFLTALVIAVVLFILGMIFPPGSEYTFGAFEINLSETLSFFGRESVIRAEEIPEVLIVYWGVAVWIAGGYFARAPRLFPAIALGMAALQVAAITIQPFLYAAVFIELLAVVSIPLLVEAGQQVRQGVIRMIVFYTLGMAAILFAGWMLTGGDPVASGSDLLFTAAMLLAIGFILLLAIFPAYSWVPMILQKGNPYPGAFTVFWLIQATLLFSNGLFSQYDLIASGTLGAQVVTVLGMLIILTFGAFLLFQENLGRILGFTIQLEVGFVLLAVVVQTASDSAVFYALLFSRTLPFMLWALSAAALHHKLGNLDFSSIQGTGYHLRWMSAGLVLSILAVLGLPLLPVFPIKLVIMQAVSTSSSWLYLGVVLGSVGLVVSLLRIFAVLFAQDPQLSNLVAGDIENAGVEPGETIAPSEWVESRQVKLILLAGIILMFLGGIFSGSILSALM